jgi:maleylpyruvate isomerase
VPPNGRTVPLDLDPADPAAAAAQLGALVGAATERLRRGAAAISDQQAREPSALPGWSRGHVLTHIARNADSLRNLLIWARTGVVTPQYGSPDAREQGIAAGAGRSATELLADLEASAAALSAETARLGDADWAVEVQGMRGAGHPAWFTLWRRLTEVEIHHVDLAAGYGPDDWPEAFAVTCLERVAGDFAEPDAPAVLLRSSDSGQVLPLGPAGATPAGEISGPARALLAWLTGRGNGAGLTAQPAGPLPVLPSW